MGRFGVTHLKRKICYISGTRADYGLMATTLREIHADSRFDLSLCVTGMHLSETYGETVNEIVADDLCICARIPVEIEHPTGASMARGMGVMLQRFVDVLERERPDVVLLLGDRGEMLAGALAAIHLNIPILHIHGGERSGTVDEPIRHAISKLSHWHCVATQEARERLIRMGEQPNQIIVTGAPGLDGLQDLASISRDVLCRELDLDPSGKLALMVFHPVIQEAALGGVQAKVILDSLLERSVQVLALMPNSDSGSQEVRAVLEAAVQHTTVRIITHLPRQRFISWMAASDVMIGNSSSGIIEAATFGTPVINVGIRQNFRERNTNVRDIAANPDALYAVLGEVLARGRFVPANVYGDGQAGARIVELLANLPLQPSILLKTNAY